MLKGLLLLLAASGADPFAVLRRTVMDGGLDDARDPAAVLSWRLDRVENTRSFRIELSNQHTV